MKEELIGRLKFKKGVNVSRYGSFCNAQSSFADFVIYNNLQDMPFSVYFNRTENTFLRCVFDNGLEFSDLYYPSYTIPIHSSALTFKTEDKQFREFFVIVSKDKNSNQKEEFKLDIPAKTLNSKTELVIFINELLEHLKGQ
ncbi:hypothetical protein [Proteus phage PM2]|uniref:Uncharacterized protein n=1 Tax=Proteus phage PM2 TaxID=2025809 RepID=A0A249XX34_9CAUD|nr:hypothetical protein KNT71_gp101 [Proteus phage PM2]ASZ76531.1 hypothetical protein [Proteus phage PM2]